jgi:hypothetical protein
MEARTPEDRLRAQYFDLLPEMRRVLWQLEAEIRFHTLPILHGLGQGEQLEVDSRLKDCESALEKLLRIRGDEGRTFDPDRNDEYSLLELPDLVGVRVLVFPNRRLGQVDATLQAHFQGWAAKPLKNRKGNVLAPRYTGYCNEVSRSVQAEYQVVPMLLGLFWRVEHPAMYKFGNVGNSRMMRDRRARVEEALAHFEEGVESFLGPPVGDR